MRDVPIARVTAVTAGRPSGIAAAASATAVNMRSSNLSPEINPMMKTMPTMTPASFASECASVSSCFWRGVFSVSVSWRRPAMWPISVFIPVAVTANSARPLVTVVFMNTAHLRSPMEASSLTGSSDFVDARLSPVNDASSISRLTAERSRPSEGTRSPASMRTMSPGTICSVGTFSSSPLRRTRADDASIFFNALRDASALFS